MQILRLSDSRVAYITRCKYGFDLQCECEAVYDFTHNIYYKINC